MMNSERYISEIVNNEAAQRWEAHVGQHIAVTAYQRSGVAIIFTHTEVPPALEGRGIASQLVQAALDDARTQQLAVIPFCPFVAAYIRRHPDYKVLVPPDYHDLVAESPAHQRVRNGK